MRNGVFPAIWVNKDVTIISDCCHHCELVSPEGTQEGKNTCHLAAIRLQPLPVVSLKERKLGMWEHRILAPDGWGAYERNDFSEPTFLHLPLHSSVQSLSCVWLVATQWDAAHQATISISSSWNLLKVMSIEPVMPSNHLVLCCPLLLLPSIFLSIRVFSNVSVLRIRWPKYWSFSFSISPSSEYSGLISFRRDGFDLLEVQGTLKSLLQHHSSKASVLQHSAFFIVQLSQSYMTTGKTKTLTTRRTFVGKVLSRKC